MTFYEKATITISIIAIAISVLTPLLQHVINYELTIEINYGVKKNNTFKYNFSISEDDYIQLCKNPESIIFGQLYKQANHPLIPFHSVSKSL